MAEDERKAGLYQEWNEDLRRRYIALLDDIIDILRTTPLTPHTVTNTDINRVLEVLAALDIAEDGKLNEMIQVYAEQGWIATNEYGFPDLHDVRTLRVLKGLARGLAIRKIEKGELKPGNPTEEKLDEIVEEYMGGKNDEES